MFGSAEPVESYCAHLLLSRDEIYFTVLDNKGPCSVYGPRPTCQVCLNVLVKDDQKKQKSFSL